MQTEKYRLQNVGHIQNKINTQGTLSDIFQVFAVNL